MRIRWIDTAKFLGIFAIYLGHFGTEAGNSYNFVFQYHVALFFLLSGCTSNYDQETNVIRFLVKKVQNILVPFWGFSILAIMIYMIHNNVGLEAIKDFFPIIIKGNIRNTFLAGSLWFLSCLFVMEIIFKCLKFIKKKWIIFLACIIMYIIAEKVISPHPLVEPHWYFNADSALYYIIFFAIGYMIYPYVTVLFTLDSIWKKIIFIITGGLSLVYSALIFLGRDCLTPIMVMFPALAFLKPIIRALFIIWANLVVAKLIENIDLLNEIGKNTLYLCGNEFIIRTLSSCLVGIIGLEINLSSPLSAYVYTAVLLIVCLKSVIRVEKQLLNSAAISLKNIEIR